MPFLIKDIKAREIIDSRGKPTVETVIYTDKGISAGASVPSGASTGSHEAKELRDNDPERFHGNGVLKSVNIINTKLKSLLLGEDISDQKRLDALMVEADGTKDKSKFGSNSILSVSLSAAKTASKCAGLPLYQYIKVLGGNNGPLKNVTPIFNVINGGMHANGKFHFQEFIMVPDRFKQYDKALQMGVEIYSELKAYLSKNGYSASVGDEGGFTPDFKKNEEVLETLKIVINNSKYKYADEVYLGLDLASSTFYKDSKYFPETFDSPYQSEEYLHYLTELKNRFNLFSLEDPLSEDDWNNWKKLTADIGKNTLIIGDDLLVTDLARLKKAIENRACNAVLVKLNQIGSLSETLEVITTAKNAGFKIIISHRSGETNEDFIADLAVGTGSDYIKAGAPARGERLAKYNRLKEIYENLG